jgi:hypothetical protein
MTASPFLFESKSGKSRYTRLFACISEEEDCYTVQVKLSNETKPEDSALASAVLPSTPRNSRRLMSQKRSLVSGTLSPRRRDQSWSQVL